MARRYGWVWGLLLALATSGSWGADLPVLDATRVTERQLANGLKLVVKEERQWPVVAVGVYVRAGSLYEAAGEEGAAHLLEHMLFESSGEDGLQLAPELERLGAQVTATTLRDFVHVDVTVASRFLERVLPSLVKAVFEPQFDDKAVRRELAVVKRELGERGERANIYLDDMLWSLAFQKHPYGRPIGGRPENLTALTPDKVRGFASKWYVPNNASFVATGDLDTAWLTSRLTELTAKYPARPVTWQAPPEEAAPAQPRVLNASMSREVSLLGFAWHAPAVADKAGVCAMDLIYTILGEGAAGRLEQRLVEEKKVALSVETEFLTQKCPGLMVINALVPRGREQEAQIMILEEVRRLREEPLSADELEHAKRLVYTDYAFTNESYDDQVGSMGFYQSIDTYRFALDYITQVMRITPGQVQEVARKYLGVQNYSLVILEAASGAGQEPGVQL